MSRSDEKWSLGLSRNRELFLREIGADKPGGGTIGMYLFRPDDILKGIIACDRLTLHAMRGIAEWLKITGRLKPQRAPLCLACEHEFSRRSPLPVAFLITVPYFKAHEVDQTAVLVTGICSACSAQSNDDLLHCARDMWLRNNPSARELTEGHA
jgi:hypothetical protein